MSYAWRVLPTNSAASRPSQHSMRLMIAISLFCSSKGLLCRTVVCTHTRQAGSSTGLSASARHVSPRTRLVLCTNTLQPGASLVGQGSSSMPSEHTDHNYSSLSRLVSLYPSFFGADATRSCIIRPLLIQDNGRRYLDRAQAAEEAFECAPRSRGREAKGPRDGPVGPRRTSSANVKQAPWLEDDAT